MPVVVRGDGDPSGAGVKGDCDLLDIGTGNLTEVLCKPSMHSYPLGHLSGPFLGFCYNGKDIG